MRSLLVLVLLVPALSGCVGGEEPHAAAPTGQIDGAVVDQFLRPYAATPVHLLELERRDVTNDLGGFSFRDVPPGVYTVQVVVAGPVTDEQTVTVEAHEVSRTILQAGRPVPEDPHVVRLSHAGGVDVAVPGAGCPSCSWTTPLGEPRPDHVYLEARWEDEMAEGSPSGTSLRVELRDQTGRLITSVEGRSPLQRYIDGSDIPGGADQLEVRVRFHRTNEVPHVGFEMDSRLCLFFATDPQHGAC